jgi:hypothetical protein
MPISDDTDRHIAPDGSTHDLLRQMVRNGADMARDLGEIKARLCGGEQRFDDHARRMGDVEAAVKVATAHGIEQAQTIVLLQDRVSTLKAIVYGAVATVLLGVLGTAGAALLIVIKMGGKP